MGERTFDWVIGNILIRLTGRMWHPAIIRFARAIEINLYPPIHFKLSIALIFIGLDIFIGKNDLLKLESTPSKP